MAGDEVTDQENEFIEQLSRKLLTSVIHQPNLHTLNEDNFEDILRGAFAKLPESELRTNLLSNISRHVGTLYRSYQERIPVILGKKRTSSGSNKGTPKTKKSKKTESEFPFIFTKFGVTQHLETLESKPWTSNTDPQYNLLLLNEFLPELAIESYFELARRFSDFQESEQRLFKIQYLSTTETQKTRKLTLANCFENELKFISELSPAPSAAEFDRIFKISADYFCISNYFIRENLAFFFKTFTNFIVIAQKAEKKSTDFFPILINLLGAQNGTGLLEVLFDVESPSKILIDLYRRCFTLNTLHSTALSLDFIIKLVILSIQGLSLFSTQEKDKWLNAVTGLSIPSHVRAKLKSLDASAPADASLLDHFIERSSIKLLKSALTSDKKPITVVQDKEEEEEDAPLFFVDTAPSTNVL